MFAAGNRARNHSHLGSHSPRQERREPARTSALPAASKQLTYSFSRHRCLFLVPEGPTTDRDLETPYDTGKIDWPVELLSGLNITDESGIPFSIPGRRLIIREIEFVTGFFYEKTKISKNEIVLLTVAAIPIHTYWSLQLRSSLES